MEGFESTRCLGALEQVLGVVGLQNTWVPVHVSVTRCHLFVSSQPYDKCWQVTLCLDLHQCV